MTTKPSVNYRPATGEQRCGNCSSYRDGRCAKVNGVISPEATCDLWRSAELPSEFKEWARNNVPGKKGFQPKPKTDAPSASSTGRPSSAPPSTTVDASAARAVATESIVLDEIGASGIRMLSTIDRASGVQGYPIMHPKTGRLGYAIENNAAVMDGSIQVASRRDGYRVRGVYGDWFSYGSTDTSAKAALARNWNSGGTKEGRAAALHYGNVTSRGAYDQSPPWTSIGNVGQRLQGGRMTHFYRLQRPDGRGEYARFDVRVNPDGSVGPA